MLRLRLIVVSLTLTACLLSSPLATAQEICVEVDDIDGDGLLNDVDPCPGDPLNDSDEDGVCDSYDMCLETVLPETDVPLLWHKRGRWALTDDDSIFDTRCGRRNPNCVAPDSSPTLHATAGCSCSQILDHLEENADYRGRCRLWFDRLFGCRTSTILNWIENYVQAPDPVGRTGTSCAVITREYAQPWPNLANVTKYTGMVDTSSYCEMTPLEGNDDGSGRKLGEVKVVEYDLPRLPIAIPPWEWTADDVFKAIYGTGEKGTGDGVWFGPPDNFYAAGSWEGVPCADWTIVWKNIFTGLMIVHIDSIEWNNIIKIPKDPELVEPVPPYTVEWLKWDFWNTFRAELEEHERLHEFAFQGEVLVINDALICNNVLVFDGSDDYIKGQLRDYIRKSDAYQHHKNTTQEDIENDAKKNPAFIPFHEVFPEYPEPGTKNPKA